MLDRNPDPADSLNDMERRLRSWQPSGGGLDRDRMLFEAGLAAARRPVGASRGAWAWRLATAAAVLVAVGLGLAWRAERTQRQVLEPTLAARTPGPADHELATARPAPPTEPSSTGIDPSSYLALARSTDPQADPSLPGPPGDGKAAPRGRHDGRSGQTLRPHDLDRVISL